MKAEWTFAACSLVAVLASACGSNQAVRPPLPPEQKTSLQPEDPRKYSIHDLNGQVAGDQQTLYEGQRNASIDLICVSEDDWVMKNLDDASSSAAIKGASLDSTGQRALSSTLQFFGNSFQGIERAYARFQDFRRLYDGAPHDQMLLRVAIQQGLTTLYWGRRLIDFSNAFEGEHCSLKPFRAGLKATSNIMSDVGQGQLPALLRIFEDSGDTWANTLMRIQLGILAGQDVAEPCAKAAKDMGSAATNFDASIMSWCGYAAAKTGRADDAQRYWKQAGQSVHDPEGASYSLARLRDASEAPTVGRVRVIPLKEE